MANTPRLEIEYCTGCRWLLRAGWVAQELLTTFQDELGEVALIPGSGGVFEVRIEGQVVWSRSGEGRLPELAELKRRVRDHVAPDRSLGHSDQ
ncbi:MAG: SelT/SelW/SelH family protein [Gemmatimonas sp.]|nr:SelT/SelW/SelH family protein [Gemmatimonas sp.]